MTRYAVALGSNLGDRVHHLRSAVDQIGLFVTDIKASRLYETAPVGGPDQGPYLNAVITFRSHLGPIDLLRRLQEIEVSEGRARDVRWGPRPLDLDIIVSEDGAVDLGPDLVIPHPRCGERRFVVEPMMDVWPDAQLAPGVTFDDVHERVADQDVDAVSSNWLDPGGVRPGPWLVAVQILLFLLIGALVVLYGSLDSGGVGAYLGLALAGAGVLLMLSAAAALGTSLSILPEPLAGGGLVAHGPFRWVRHPIYSGVLMMFAGVAVAFGSKWALVATGVLAVFFYFKASYEERELRIAYPDYHAYMGEVSKRFVPFVV